MKKYSYVLVLTVALFQAESIKTEVLNIPDKQTATSTSNLDQVTKSLFTKYKELANDVIRMPESIQRRTTMQQFLHLYQQLQTTLKILIKESSNNETLKHATAMLNETINIYQTTSRAYQKIRSTEAEAKMMRMRSMQAINALNTEEIVPKEIGSALNSLI